MSLTQGLKRTEYYFTQSQSNIRTTTSKYTIALDVELTWPCLTSVAKIKTIPVNTPEEYFLRTVLVPYLRVLVVASEIAFLEIRCRCFLFVLFTSEKLKNQPVCDYLEEAKSYKHEWKLTQTTAQQRQDDINCRKFQLAALTLFHWTSYMYVQTHFVRGYITRCVYAYTSCDVLHKWKLLRHPWRIQGMVAANPHGR